MPSPRPLDLQAYLRSRQAMVERALRGCLPVGAPPQLKRAMAYSLLAGGKRLRPVLLLAAGEACGAAARSLLPAACAFEVLHTYSLIHDDLPAMDDDDLRRGRPTAHKAFGEAAAILAGDALLTLAFELMARQARAPRVGAARALEASRLLARAAGAAGMVGGQALDLAGEGRRLSLAQLKDVHRGKTGALIQAALEAGAALAGAGPARRRRLARAGAHMGLAFQVADDILNVVGDSAKLGKPTGNDAAARKATYPGLLGLQKSRRMAQDELAAALRSLRPLGPAGEPLGRLARFIVDRDR